jgi:predicted aspartyl protease
MFRPLLAILATLAAPVAASVPQPPPTESLQTQEDRSRRMTVEVMINGQGPFRFAVDTGADRTSIAASLAARLALPPGPGAVLHGMAGIDRVETAVISELRVGSNVTTEINAPVLPDGPLGVQGLLGIDALDGQKVVMDFADRELRITPGGRRDAEDDGTIVITARRRFGQLVLVDASVEGVKVYAIIDSGAEHSIGNAALRRVLERRQAAATRKPVELVSVTGRTLVGDLSTMPRMKIGGITMAGVPIAYSDAHPFRKYGIGNKPAMLIGADLLAAFERVSLDFENKKVRFLLRDGSEAKD